MERCRNTRNAYWSFSGPPNGDNSMSPNRKEVLYEQNSRFNKSTLIGDGMVLQ